MTLRLALVIDGDNAGAKKALEETAKGVDTLKKSAEGASEPVQAIGSGLSEAADAAPRTATGITSIGTAADGASGKLTALRAGAIGLVTGVAGAFAAAGLAALIEGAFGAFGTWVADISSSAPRIKRDLEEHESLIKRIKGAYAEAQGAASSYGNESRKLLAFEQQQDIGRLAKDLRDAQAEIDTPAAFNVVEKLDRRSGGEFNVPFADAVKEFREDLKDGIADVIAFRTRVAEEASALAKDSPFRDLAEDILAATEPAARLQEELQRATDLYKGLQGDADAAATALGGSAEKLKLNGEAAAGAAPFLREVDELLASIGSRPAPATGGAPYSPPPGGGFAVGGFTGDVPADQVAGFVHGREYVFDAESTRRIGVGNLDAIRQGVRGYASGGYVGGRSGTASGGFAPYRELADDFELLRGELSGFLRDLAKTGDGLGALGGVVESVSERFLSLALGALDQLLLGGGAAGSPGGASGLLGGLLGSIARSLFGGSYFPPAPVAPVGLYHGGGTVGPQPAFTRAVPASVFMDAPRLHGGGWLEPGERPVIAMDGEEVGWPGELARKYGGGNQTVINNFNVETPNPRAFAESRSTVARAAGRLAALSGRHS